MARPTPYPWRIVIALAIAGTASMAGADSIFSDDFETGDLTNWSAVNPNPVARVRPSRLSAKA
jgi:hypothetical protein